MRGFQPNSGAYKGQGHKSNPDVSDFRTRVCPVASQPTDEQVGPRTSTPTWDSHEDHVGGPWGSYSTTTARTPERCQVAGPLHLQTGTRRRREV